MESSLKRGLSTLAPAFIHPIHAAVTAQCAVGVAIHSQVRLTLDAGWMQVSDVEHQWTWRFLQEEINI